MIELSLMGVPSSAGAFSPGQELAPAAIRAAGLIELLAERGVVVHDLGDAPTRRWTPDRVHPRAQNREAVAETVRHTTAAVQAALKDTARVLVLGGDCTVGAGAFQGLAAHDDTAGLIYIDLDADMNTPGSTEAGALDWMGLGMLLGVDGAVDGIVRLGQLAPERLALLGFYHGKSTDWELSQIATRQITTVTDSDVRTNPRSAAVTALRSLPSDTTSVAVHFDVDVIDFVDAPLSEDPNRNLGISLDDALAAVAELMGDARVRVLTITELNPQHAVADPNALPRFVSGLAAALGEQR